MPTAERYEPAATRSHGLRLKAFREETREADFIASTAAEDSYDEVVEQTWDLKRFKANPVALWAHNSRELPIGCCTRCDVVKQDDGSDALECTIQFATEDMNPKAEQVFKMVRAKMLRAVSVGFNPGSYRYEKREGREILVLSDNELFEISVVPIPANAEAIAKMRAKARELAAGAAGKDEKTMKTAEELQKALDTAIAERAAIELRASTAETTLVSSQTKLSAVETELASAKVARAALETQNMLLATERDALSLVNADVRKAVKANDAGEKPETTLDAVNRVIAGQKAAEEKALSTEMTALIGVKILPNELESMTELARDNRPLFEKMMAQRNDLSILKSVMKADPKPLNDAAPGGGDVSGSELDKAAKANASTVTTSGAGDLASAALALANVS